MQDEKDQVKSWLKATQRDREWLGWELGVTKRAVDNWLSTSNPIPAAKLSLIKRLMADDDAAAARRKQQLDPIAQVFSLEVDLPTFRAYSAAAKAAHLTLEEWSIDELNQAAAAWFKTQQQKPLDTSPEPVTTLQIKAPSADPKLNEEPAEYGSENVKDQPTASERLDPCD